MQDRPQLLAADRPPPATAVLEQEQPPVRFSVIAAMADVMQAVPDAGLKGAE